MDFPEFEAFRAELKALSESAEHVHGKILRDETLRERFRNLFRTWASSVQPRIQGHLKNTRDLFKLSAEIERLAQLASKAKPVAEYRRRLRIATQLADSLVIYLPASGADHVTWTGKQGMFITGIPDLPTALVPNAILGWRSRLEAFVREHPFDKSVFIMIRYRDRNKRLIQALKNSLDKAGFYGVLASDHNLTDDLYNPVACLLCCSRGVAVFDKAEKKEYFNPNVAYELGMLHLLGRTCLLLKDTSLKALQTDILMKLYTSYSSVNEVAEMVSRWLSNGG